MATIVDLGTAEGRLCGELAAAVAHHVANLDPVTGVVRKGARTLEDGSGTEVDAANAVLEALGVAIRDPEAAGRVRLTMDAADMPDALAAAVREDDPRLPALLETFLAIAAGQDDLSDDRAPFTPPDHYLAAMRALARLGYAERTGDSYYWTDRIGPAMRAADLWDEDLQSVAVAARAALIAEADAAWRSMPDTIRRSHFGPRPASFMDVVRVLARSWKGGRWHPYRADARVGLAGHLDLARQLVARASQGD
jgi:hypothetical protein